MTKKEIFSTAEKRVLDVLGNKTITIKELTEKVYRNQKAPLSPNNVVAVTLKRINAKCDYHKLTWFVNGAGIGRGGRTVWVDNK